MIKQGDLGLPHDPVAQRLLHSTERPSWVGLIDFQARVPRPMAEAFG